MISRLALIAFAPLFSGCIVVQHRRSLVDLGKFTGPLTDSDLVGRLLLVAALFGLAGGIVAWIAARCFTGLRAKRRQQASSGARGGVPQTASGLAPGDA